MYPGTFNYRILTLVRLPQFFFLLVASINKFVQHAFPIFEAWVVLEKFAFGLYLELILLLTLVREALNFLINIILGVFARYLQFAIAAGLAGHFMFRTFKGIGQSELGEGTFWNFGGSSL